jgi:hypothetical protein
LEIGPARVAEFRRFGGARRWRQGSVVADIDAEAGRVLLPGHAALHVPVHADAVGGIGAGHVELGVAHITGAACGSGALGTNVVESRVGLRTSKVRIGLHSLGRGCAVRVAQHRSVISAVRRLRRRRVDWHRSVIAAGCELDSCRRTCGRREGTEYQGREVDGSHDRRSKQTPCPCVGWAAARIYRAFPPSLRHTCASWLGAEFRPAIPAEVLGDEPENGQTYPDSAEVAEWQTRRIQNPLLARV